MIIGQVAVMRLLSALFLYCRKMAAIESARPVWRAACPQDSSRGIGGCPPTSGVLFVQKDTACQYYQKFLITTTELYNMPLVNNKICADVSMF